MLYCDCIEVKACEKCVKLLLMHFDFDLMRRQFVNFTSYLLLI